MLTKLNLMYALCLGVAAFALGGCESNEDGSPLTHSSLNRASDRVATSAPAAPSDLVEINAAGHQVTLWPYTSEDFAVPSDPVNLVFVGKATAAEIRAALLSLDGNRPGLPLPPIPPFNQRWSDAMGGVQTAYEETNGWLGSVIQLQIGSYGPVRVHLRLFETRQGPGADAITLGGAHFEILIPGTADHQVMSWELAEQIVKYDLARTGLLAAAPGSTGVIGPTPGFRAIPPAIYNGVPDGLKMICGLPTGPSATPVPIPTDGAATVLALGSSVALVSDAPEQDFTLQYHQIIPRPVCNGGPYDYILVEGPVSLHKAVRTSGDRYEYDANIRADLVATPMDVTKNPPQPAGEPFRALASDVQFGFLSGNDARVSMQSKRIVHEDAAEKEFVTLVVHELGVDQYSKSTKCLGE